MMKHCNLWERNKIWINVEVFLGHGFLFVIDTWTKPCFRFKEGIPCIQHLANTLLPYINLHFFFSWLYLSRALGPFPLSSLFCRLIFMPFHAPHHPSHSLNQLVWPSKGGRGAKIMVPIWKKRHLLCTIFNNFEGANKSWHSKNLCKGS